MKQDMNILSLENKYKWHRIIETIYELYYNEDVKQITSKPFVIRVFSVSLLWDCRDYWDKYSDTRKWYQFDTKSDWDMWDYWELL